MPDEIRVYLERIQQRILEELLFAANSTVYGHILAFLNAKIARLSREDAIEEVAAISYENRNDETKTALLDKVLGKVFDLAGARTADLCREICSGAGLTASNPEDAELAAAFGAAAQSLVLTILYKHVDILFRRHLTHIILSGIFCTVRVCVCVLIDWLADCILHSIYGIALSVLYIRLFSCLRACTSMVP